MCHFETQFKECKDVCPTWKKHLIDINSTNNSNPECLHTTLVPNCECNPPCDETTYTMTSTKVEGNENKVWEFYLEHKVSITENEQPDYPIQEFLGALGGVIGLGAKFMNALQLLIFICLCIANFAKH